MADPVLHIKDSFYFEVPTFLAPARYTEMAQFPDVWIKNDDQFQHWSAERLYHRLERDAGTAAELPPEHELIETWHHWQHEDHANFARPLDVYIEMFAQRYERDYQDRTAQLAPEARPTYAEYLATQQAEGAEAVWAAQLLTHLDQRAWTEARQHARGHEAIQAFRSEPIEWSAQKIAAYNDHLSGKILLQPQPFAELKNLYEPEPWSLFPITKLMILQVIVGLLMFGVFTAIATRLRTGQPPRGRFWNLIEVFLLFIRDQIARPAIGGHHAEHEEEHPHSTPTGVEPGHGIGGAGLGGPPAEVSKIHEEEGHGHPSEAHHAKHGEKHGKHEHHHNPFEDADRFVPLLWTIFFFVLFCNLFGLIPWLGGPTAAFGVTFGLALCTFIAVVIGGMMKFGFIGFFTNQVPTMDLPLPLAILLKPMIFAIEILGLIIKHMVLSIRLLANMVAGHLVILGILGLAFGLDAAAAFTAPDAMGWLWWIVAAISVVSAALFNLLELFVAFLQAYVFTFLSALFIGAAVHKH
jgi:F-type H+-transporting ATPase subunit a